MKSFFAAILLNPINHSRCRTAIETDTGINAIIQRDHPYLRYLAYDPSILY